MAVPDQQPNETEESLSVLYYDLGMEHTLPGSVNVSAGRHCCLTSHERICFCLSPFNSNHVATRTKTCKSSILRVVVRPGPWLAVGAFTAKTLQSTRLPCYIVTFIHGKQTLSACAILSHQWREIARCARRGAIDLEFVQFIHNNTQAAASVHRSDRTPVLPVRSMLQVLAFVRTLRSTSSCSESHMASAGHRPYPIG